MGEFLKNLGEVECTAWGREGRREETVESREGGGGGLTLIPRQDFC